MLVPCKLLSLSTEQNNPKFYSVLLKHNKYIFYRLSKSPNEEKEEILRKGSMR